MPKDAMVSMRVTSEVKEALQRAAEDDQRSLSALAQVVFTQWLRERRYLPEPARRKPGSRRGA